MGLIRRVPRSLRLTGETTKPGWSLSVLMGIEGSDSHDQEFPLPLEGGQY